VEDDFLSVKLIVDHHIHIVGFFLNVDWHIDTSARQMQRDRLRVVLILEEKSQLLVDFSQLGGHKCKLDLGVRIAINLSDSLEAHGRDELVKDYLGGPFDLVVVFGQFFWGDEGDCAALSRLHVDFSGEGALVVDFHVLSARFAENHVAEVAVLLFNFD